MSKLSPQDKVVRVVRLLFGLRSREVAAALAAHGMTAADIEEGFRLLASVTVRDVKTAVVVLDPKELEEKLIAWARRWFPIVEAALGRHQPEALSKLFPEIVTGPKRTLADAVFFLRAWDELGPEHPAVKLLQDRGLTDVVIRELRTVAEPATKAHGQAAWPGEDFTEAETKLWEWYLEWSGIVRARVKDKRVLRELGFGVSKSADSDA